MLNLQQIERKNQSVSSTNIKLILLVLCLLVCSALSAKPEIPALKIVHVGKYQDKTVDIPNENRFKTLDKNYLIFQSDYSDAYWIKPILNNQAISANHVFTFIPTSLDSIKMFIPEINANQPITETSRFDIISQEKFSHRSKVFEVPSNYKPGQEIYFYITARDSTEIRMEYWELDEYLIIDREHSSIYSAVFASLFILIIINFIFYLAFKDKNYLRYVFYLATFLTFILMSSGKIYQFSIGKYIAGNYNSTLALFTLTGFSLVLFVQGYLNLKNNSPIFYRFTQFINCIYILIFFIALFIWPAPYSCFLIVNIIALIAMPIALINIIGLWIKGNAQAKYFVWAYTPLFIMIGLRIFVILNIIPPWKFALSGFQLAVVFQALILSLGLADRVLSIQKQRDEAKDESQSVTSLLKNDKNFSMFLSRVSADIRAKPNEDHSELVINSFFTRLSNLFNIKQGAIVSQIEGKLQVQSSDQVSQTGFESYVNSHLEEINKICNHIKPTELGINKHPFFSRFTKMLLLPVHMRGHEWSCMVLNVDLTQKLSNAEVDSLQRYSTELIRTLVNAEKMKHFSIKSETDHLTQVLNRGAILDSLKNEISNLPINKYPLSIAFVDVDHFKKINDQLGHEAGDTCLSYLAYQIRRHQPTGCHVGRMGGDEFLFVLPNHNPEQASACLQSIMDSLDTLIIEDNECSFTLSIGIAQYKFPDMDLKGLLRHADESLYQSKENGRNQISISTA